MVFADMNADKYTDLLMVDAQSQKDISIYTFNPRLSLFEFYQSFTPQDCRSISNIAVGRSFKHLRLFITCQPQTGDVAKLAFYDYEASKGLFSKVKFEIEMAPKSQPFIADFNGDFLQDVMFNTVEGTAMQVAYQDKETGHFKIKPFQSSMLVQDETVGCISKTIPSAILSTPHSASMIDLDGDCISDLFLTVQSGG